MASDEYKTRLEGESPGPEPDPPPVGADLPDRIGRFSVRALLGEGGMGVVFDAWDPELKRRVAIKLLRPALRAGSLDSGAGARLQREAESMARLSHPNVVQIYEVGQWSGAVFLAMEFIEGDNLRDWLERAPRSWRDVVEVFLQAGHGLAAAHAAGIIHRDFKPDNVLVGADGRTRVLDFGLARPHTERTRLREFEDSGSITLTRADSLIGTPAYMSPEQHMRLPVDTRSDQFSFCVALWEALYGERPFAGKTVGELRHAVFQPPPPPRTARAPRRLLRVLLRGLQPAPEARYPDMPALLDDLAVDPAAAWRRVAALAALLALTATIFVLASRPPEPGPRCPVAADSLVGVWDDPRSAAARDAVVAADPEQAAETWPKVQQTIDAWTAAWVATRAAACSATRERHAASEELLHLRNQCLDDGLRDLNALVDALVTADAATAEHALEAVQRLPSPATCLDEATVRARIKPPADPLLAAAVTAARQRLAQAEALLHVGRPREARDIAEQVLYAAVAVDHAPLHAEILLTLGRAAEADIDLKAARDHLVAAYDVALAAAHDDIAAEAAILLSDVLQQDARYIDGLTWSRHAAGMVARTGDRPRQRALALLYEAENLYGVSRYEEAITTAERALAYAEANLAAEDILLARIITAIAQLHERVREPHEALPLHMRVRDEWSAILGQDHPLLIRTNFKIGEMLYERDRDIDGLAQMYAALAALERALGPDHPEVAAMVAGLGDLAKNDDRLRDAIAAASRAESIYAARLGPDHPAATWQLDVVLQAHLELGEDNEALAVGRRILARLAIRGARERRIIAFGLITRLHLSDVLIAARRHDEAERECLIVLDDARRIARNAVVHALHNLAQIARARGDARKAEVLLAQAIAMITRGHADSIYLFLALAEVHLDRGRTAEAVDACSRAVQYAAYYARRGKSTPAGVHLCLGRALLAHGAPGPAIAELELAVDVAATQEMRPGDRAEARAALAQALRRRDPARARTLAAQARVDYAAAGPAFAPDADRLAWSGRR